MVRKVTLLVPVLIAAIAVSPEATLAQSNDDGSGCYIQMPGGRSMDLSALCGQSAPTVNSRFRTNSSTQNYAPAQQHREVAPTCHGSACGYIETSPGVYVNGYPVYPDSSTRYYSPGSSDPYPNTQYYAPQSPRYYPTYPSNPSPVFPSTGRTYRGTSSGQQL